MQGYSKKIVLDYVCRWISPEQAKGGRNMANREYKSDVFSMLLEEIKPGDELYILKNSACPAVIVECGFLSNPEECENLQQPAYQQEVAAAIARAVTRQGR